ncbi:MAG: hypothetical protein V7642_3768 [Burkholderiales bacterium]|jgi:UDP-N-acetylmuramyl pentapeptide phosphotransferase/UDP-N-acetylglucosamine-1-phosphate transferase
MEFAMVGQEMLYRGGELIFTEIRDWAFLDTLLVALLVSLGACAINIVTERWHGRYSFDVDVRGIQKVHKNMVPRTGGIALLSGVLAVAVFGNFEHLPVALQAETRSVICKLLLAAIPAFAAGIIEDLTKTVSVRTRLCSIFASAVLAALLLGAHLPRLDIWVLDGALDWIPISIAITAFAVVGVTNSINIIDGFHGVAGATAVIVLAGAGYLAWRSGDALVAQLAFAGIGATIGFLLLNYPTGRLFMGDGGAYFIGFWAAEVAVLTIVRNPEINAWQILAIYAYPVIEVLFSMYRRKILHDRLVGAPDRLHLHSLFYRRVACQRISAKKYPWSRNAGVACFVATWLATATVSAVLFGNTIPGAVSLVLAQILIYVAVYMRLVRGHWGRCRNPAVILGLRPQYRSRSI